MHKPKPALCMTNTIPTALAPLMSFLNPFLSFRDCRGLKIYKKEKVFSDRSGYLNTVLLSQSFIKYKFLIE